ncbi:hypothetical protein ACFQL1_05460 [Halomicroarcula sp. GCM10025709]|uniref:hypothetical protein n=1 Tax=Haloarcula TaxID=2237 RepID=UPI0024C3C6B2|nr:hypothetical protein [Halomicroarcula sp. YJ-61-S]
MASDGDIRVLLVLNLLLSATFSAVVVWGASLVGLASFTAETILLGTFALAFLTYLVVLR